ncbi:hypothetical protein NQ315_009548 [Exocentrus adspersus]|uniref:Uncharacterized protein n=1 Tax=Exocentrus adspersus TaxID=1586481 RepID=A0AAV8WHI3_9CUCU|nr:hypothetical protein NQ315_009548 [Exocentrus adspersus]
MTTNHEISFKGIGGRPVKIYPILTQENGMTGPEKNG